MGRVADLAVERDHVAAAAHERRQPLAERLARGHWVSADLVLRQRRRGIAVEAVRLAGALGLGHVDVDRPDVAQLLDRLLRILERLAVLALDVGRLGRAIALDRARDDHRRTVGSGLGLGVGAVDGRDVVAVDLDRVPVAGSRPVGVGAQVPAVHRLAALAEPVDVDDRHQVVQALLAGVLDGLPDRALGHLGVAAQRPHAIGQPVEVTRAQRDPGGDRHALAERAGGDVDPRQLGRRVALQAGAELAEGEQLLVGDRAGGDEHRVDERRGVALGEDQVVVVGVLGVVVVVAQVTGHQDRHQVGRRHRRGGVPRLGGVGRTDRVDPQALGELVNFFVGHLAYLWDRGLCLTGEGCATGVASNILTTMRARPD